MKGKRMLLFFGIVVAIEIYYWFIYFPRAYSTPGTNQDIDLIRDCLRGPK